ncbi:MAG TPA: hypothetical protein VG820_06160, partial [Fimbriimonadaceae bacterium]|nr:hypothetical protein [Fimbriimonadaceae bacterium]
RMEAEARAVATSVLQNFATPNGLHVEHLYKTYQANEGLGREDAQRLDRIGNIALRQVQEMVGAKNGRLDLVEVSIELDLGQMSEEEAARIWAEAIVEQIHRLPMQPKTAVPQPSLIQRAPVADPAATPDAAPKPPDRVVVAAMGSFMRSDVDDIVGMLKANMAGLMQVQILAVFEKWKALDDKYFEETGFRGTVYLDKFIQILFNKTFNNGGIFIDRWTNGYDECYFQMADGGKAALKEIVHESKIWGSGPVTEEPESVWSYIGKRELYTGLTMVKHLSTGLSGVFDAGAWVGQKISGQKFDFSLSEYVGKSWDENILAPTAKGLGVNPNEKLIGKYTLKNVADLGGKTVSGLTMAGALLPEAGASAAVRIGAAGVGMAQAGQSAEQLYDQVKAMRKAGKTWKEIVSEPEVWVEAVGVIAGAVGSAGGFAKEGSELAKTLTGLGHAATGTQLATLGAAIYVTNTDKSLSDAEKTARISDFASTFLVTGSLAVNAKYGKNFESAWTREIQQETGQKMLPPGPEPPKQLPAGPEPPKMLPPGAEPPKLLPPGPEPPKMLPPGPEEPKLLPSAPKAEPHTSPKEQIQAEGSWENLKKQAGADPEAQQRLHAARMEIHAEARQALAEKYPTVEWEQLGASTKMSNDADVTMKPKLPPNPTPQDVAKAVALSGEAAEFVRAKLREAVKGDPGAAIDTNIYTYTGSEAAIDIPKAQQASVALKLDAAGLAAMKESMTPTEWADFKQRALEKAQPSNSKPNEVGPAQFEFERRARADMEARLNEAEKTTADIEDAKTKTRENLLKEHPELKGNRALLDGLTRDKAADTFRSELVEALGKGDMARARELQTKIKMVEEGAYVTPAAYENVVQAQQRMSRGESKFESLSTDPHENAQAAADIYAQMKKHADAGSLMDRLKSVAKNRARLEIEAGRPGDIPYIEENFSQSRMKDNYNQLHAEEGQKVANDDKAALRKMVTDWAQTTPDNFTPELAESFIQAQLKSGLDVVLGLQTASAGLRGYETPAAGPEKPPTPPRDNPPSGGGKGKGPNPPKGPGGGEGENNGPPPKKGPHKARTKIPTHDMSEFKSAGKVADLIRQTGGKGSPLYQALKEGTLVKVRGAVAEHISFEALKQIYPNQMPLEDLVKAPPPAKGKRPPSTILRNVQVVDLGVPAEKQTVTEIDAIVLQQHKRGFEVAMIEQVKSSNEAGDAITQSYRSMNYLRMAQENPNIRFRVGGVNGQDITSTLLEASTENTLLVARMPSDDAHGQYDKATGRGRFQDPPQNEDEAKVKEPKPSLRRQARIENLGANRGEIDKASDEMLKHRDEILKYFEGEGD